MSERVIVSMTSYPKRITNVGKAIYLLLTKQTRKPDEIHLWLAEPEFLNKENRNSMQENYNGLSNRPDWDGQLNLSEANNWYRNGNGNPLYVDAAKVDLSPLSKSDFSAIGSSKHVNFLDPKNLNIQTGLVYGTIQVTLIDDGGTVRIGNKNGLLDIYDFDMQRGRGFRNIATQIGSMVAGEGTPFNIYYYGQGKVK